MVFQDPMTSLNPVYRVGRQIVEAIRAHTEMSDDEAEERAIEMLRRSGSPSRSAASTTTRTSSRAGCASGR